MTTKAPAPITPAEASAIAYDLARVSCKGGGVFLKIDRARDRMAVDAWDRFLAVFAAERRAIASGRKPFDETAYKGSIRALLDGLKR